MEWAERLRSLIARCERPGKAFEGVTLATRVLRGDPPRLAAMVRRSLGKLRVVYPFVHAGAAAPGPARVSVSITDVVRERDRPVVEWYTLSAAEGAELAASAFELVTLIEEGDLPAATAVGIGETAFVRFLLGRNAFVHVARNCIRFLEDTLEGGAGVEWTAFRMGYAKGPVTEKQNLYLCLYWIGGSPPVRIHIADEAVVQALHEYGRDIVGEPSRFRHLSSSSNFTRIPASGLSQLIDHPVFNYYLFGGWPKLGP
jgi:hypothetical protein